jgi:hypothetical protein
MASAPPKVRDRLWIWGHETNSHYKLWNIETPSRITPAEGAYYLGTPNLIMVRFNDKPAPPYDQYMTALKPLQQVVWSIVGAGGTTDSDEVDQFLDLASKFPNITGAMMDDFLHNEEGGKMATFTPEEVSAIQDRLVVDGRKLDLWVVLYDYQLDRPFEPHFEACDVTTFWTWNARDLVALEANFEKLNRKMPDSRKVLGVYLYDYGESQPMPVETVRGQTELGLRWLREGRIEGMIFLASCVGDIGLEAVEWARDWIARVGEETL